MKTPQVQPVGRDNRLRGTGSGSALARLGVLLLISALAGCSSLWSEHARFVEGWRPGEIVQIGKGATIDVRFFQDCRESPSPGVASVTPYVLVRYSRAPKRYGYLVTPLVPGQGLAVGDRVEVNIDSCQTPAMD